MLHKTFLQSILKDLDVVADTDPACLVDGGELAEGQIKSLKEGNNEANHKCGNGGQHEYGPPLLGCFDH